MIHPFRALASCKGFFLSHKGIIAYSLWEETSIKGFIFTTMRTLV